MKTLIIDKKIKVQWDENKYPDIKKEDIHYHWVYIMVHHMVVYQIKTESSTNGVLNSPLYRDVLQGKYSWTGSPFGLQQDSTKIKIGELLLSLI
jgi:hypothetical protein